jgi:hypothetical protein
MSFRDTEGFENLRDRYGWFDNGDTITDKYGVPLVATGKQGDDEWFGIERHVEHDNEIWWVFEGYIYHDLGILNQAYCDTHFDRHFTTDQLDDIACLVWMVDEGACFSKHVKFPLLFSRELEIPVNGTVQEVLFQFSRFAQSRLPLDVTTWWDDHGDNNSLANLDRYQEYPSDSDSTLTGDTEDETSDDEEDLFWAGRVSPRTVIDFDDDFVIYWEREEN